MANELQPLSILYQNRLFRIPDYQRGYAWRHEQLADFWEDLLNLHDDRYHYTGLLSLKMVSKKDAKAWDGDDWLLENGYKPFHVVDGQQRLTTFSILVNEIATFVKGLPENEDKEDDAIFLGFESLKKLNEKYIVLKRPPQHIISTYLFGYEADNPSAKYLKYKVFDEPNGGSVDETYYTKNLKYAKTFFYENLRALYNSEGLDAIGQIYRKLTQRFMFNLHEIEDDYDVFVAFETMNNRGKKLTSLELLKNRLIYLTTLFDDNQLDVNDKTQLRYNINEAWKEVYYQLGRNQNAPLDDDEFLRAHWITYFRYSRKGGDDYIRFLLGKFSAKNVYEKLMPLQGEEDDIVLTDIASGEEDEIDAPTTDAETQLVSKLAPKEINDYVKSLQMLAKYWYYSFFPYESDFADDEKLWIDRLNRVGIAYYRPLVATAMATAKNSIPEDRIALFKAIERFIFVEFRLSGFQSNYQSSVYYNKSRDVLSGEVSLASVTESLNSTVDNDMDSAIRAFIARTKKRYDSGVGYYGWRDLRYFLFEYEYEKGVKNKLQKMKWEMFTHAEKDKVTIEHILPQTATKWYWQNTYRMYDEDEIRSLAISLGNMLPLSQSINSSLQNDSFPDKKKPSNGRRGYTNGSHSEIEVAQETDWTAEHIFNRGRMLLEFMEKRWGIAFDDEQKIELLHVDFINESRPVVPEIPMPVSEIPSSATSAPEHKANEDKADRTALRSNFRLFLKDRYPNYKSKDTLVSDSFFIDNNPELFDYTLDEVLSEGQIPESYVATLEAYFEKRGLERGRPFLSNHTRGYVKALELLLEYTNAKNNTASEDIGGDMTEVAYDIAKQVYEGTVRRSEGKEQIALRTGMNPGSAGDYISVFLAMMDGIEYKRTINEHSTKFFVNRIRADYGEAAFRKAIEACDKHASYYAALGRGRLVYVERIVAEAK